MRQLRRVARAFPIAWNARRGHARRRGCFIGKRPSEQRGQRVEMRPLPDIGSHANALYGKCLRRLEGRARRGRSSRTCCSPPAGRGPSSARPWPRRRPVARSHECREDATGSCQTGSETRKFRKRSPPAAPLRPATRGRGARRALRSREARAPLGDGCASPLPDGRLPSRPRVGGNPSAPYGYLSGGSKRVSALTPLTAVGGDQRAAGLTRAGLVNTRRELDRRRYGGLA